MTEKQVMILAREVKYDIARTEERSGSLDARRRTCIGMTRDVYRELDEALQERVEIQYRGRGRAREFCGYPVKVIDIDGPGVWIMRKVEVPFLRMTAGPEDDDESKEADE